VAALLEAGVTAFVDLTEEGEQPPYTAWLAQPGAAGHARLHVRAPVADYSVPSAAGMKTILDALDALLDAGQTVYLHCWGGVGRSGTVVGCWLARHGVVGRQAFEALKQLRQALPSPQRDWPSPETEEQVRMVVEWRG
jgi:protein-tyrosine phosphatase